MRFKPQFFLLAAYGAVALLLGGCSSDPSKLTRDRAAALIKQNLGSVSPLFRVTTGTMMTATLPNENRALMLIHLASGTPKTQYGVPEVTVALTGRGRQLAVSQKWQREDYPMGVVAWQIPIGTYEFGSVTGIQLTDKSHAMVTFTYTSVPNDIGRQIVAIGHTNFLRVVSPLAEASKMYPASQEQQAANTAAAVAQSLGVNTNPTMDTLFGKTASSTLPFTLYDDGWRLGQ